MTLSRLRQCASAFMFATITASATAADLIHVRLKDRLDRPDDGYCLDILGTGGNLRLDMPLFAHNCKGGATTEKILKT